MTDITPDPEATFASMAKLAAKKFGRQPVGVLSLVHGRLRFDPVKRGPLLDMALADISDVESPGWFLGASFRFNHGGKRYTFGFYETGHVGLAQQFGELKSAKQTCSAWLSLLKPTAAAEPPG